MATRKKPLRRSDLEKRELQGNKVKNPKHLEKKLSPSFVQFDGLSQSSRDRNMNNRKVKPPKNLNLIEGDSDDGTESTKQFEQIDNFPSEHLLSSTIKETNGMDFSNHFIEQYFRKSHSESESQEISVDSTSSSLFANESTREFCGEESPDKKSNLRAYSGKTNHDHGVNNFHKNSEDLDVKRIEKLKREFCRNAAIMGLIENNLIELNKLKLNEEEEKKEEEAHHAEANLNNWHNDNGEKICGNVNSAKQFDSKRNKVGKYPQLVPHPEDPDFFTHPLQAYGKLDDDGINFDLPRSGKKTTMTSRQHFIDAALNDDMFAFETKPKKALEPKLDFDYPKTGLAPFSENKNCLNKELNSSYDSTINDENDSFQLNREEFPSLHSPVEKNRKKC